jgi:hypothetical protein
MGNLFKNRGAIVHVSWLVLLLYAVVSAYMLITSMNLARNSSVAYIKTEALVVYAVISFFLVALVSALHLSSLLRRRRRYTDRQRLSRAKFVRAKHRHSRKI